MDTNNNLQNDTYEPTDIFVEDVKPMPILEKFKCLFTAPSKLFENVDQAPKMALPIIISCILVIIASLIAFKSNIQYANDLKELLYQKFGIEQAKSSLNLTGTALLGVILSPISVLIVLVIGSFFTWLLSKIFKGQANFKKTMAINAHVLMFTYSFTLITSIIKALLNNYVDIFSLAILYPSGDFSMFIYDLLFLITLYGIWGTVITGIGLSVINKFSKTKGYIVSFILYALTILLGSFSMYLPFLTYASLVK